MDGKEFHINRIGYPALKQSVCFDDIYKDDDDDSIDELLDELFSMKFSEFKIKYPEQYHKYYEEKLIKSTHITIRYEYQLVDQIRKIYASPDGFTMSEIATIIQKQYKKFYQNHKRAVTNNELPKYLPVDVIEFENLCIRFHILYKSADWADIWDTYHVFRPRKIPLICIGVDT